MSQIYYLEMTAEALPVGRVGEAVAASAAAAGLLPPGTGVHLGPGGSATLTSGLHVSLFEPEPVSRPDEVATTFGIDCAVSVWMSVASSRSADAQNADVVKLTSGILPRVDGDSVLHFEYDLVWLLRHRGSLVLSDDDELWTPELLALMELPYERRPLAFSDA